MKPLKSHLGGNITIDPEILQKIESVCHVPPIPTPRGLNWGTPIDLNPQSPGLNRFWACDFKKVANIVEDVSNSLVKITHTDKKFNIETPKGDWSTTKAYPAAYALALIESLRCNKS